MESSSVTLRSALMPSGWMEIEIGHAGPNPRFLPVAVLVTDWPHLLAFLISRGPVTQSAIDRAVFFCDSPISSALCQDCLNQTALTIL
jgi:hypothetical protein